MTTFVDNASITGTRITSDGYMIGDVLCARVGCQDYNGAELGKPELGVVSVFRPESTVFDKASLATFAGKPVTIGHPSVLVDASNWKDHAVGDIGDEIARDGEFVRVPYKLMDGASIKAVNDGTREVSMGYTCDIQWGDGVAPDGTAYQATQVGPLRINHLAIVPRARGGEKLRIGDDAGNWGVSPVTDAQKEIPMLRKIMVDGLEVETTDAAAAAITKLQGQIADSATALETAKAQRDADIATKDGEIGTLKAELQTAKDAIPTPDALGQMIADRAELERVVATVAKDVKATGLTDSALRRAAVAAKFGDEMVKDASDAEVVGMFKAVARDAKPGDKIRDALLRTDGKFEDSTDPEATAYQSYLDGFNPQAKEAN